MYENCLQNSSLCYTNGNYCQLAEAECPLWLLRVLSLLVDHAHVYDPETWSDCCSVELVSCGIY